MAPDAAPPGVAEPGVPSVAVWADPCGGSGAAGPAVRGAITAAAAVAGPSGKAA